VTLLSSLFLGVLALLLLASGIRLRARLREPLVRPSLLDDAAIRAIETTGRIEIDDEPDPRGTAIEEEERRSWEEEEWE
jgi:hypothetical protein